MHNTEQENAETLQSSSWSSPKSTCRGEVGGDDSMATNSLKPFNCKTHHHVYMVDPKEGYWGLAQCTCPVAKSAPPGDWRQEGAVTRQTRWMPTWSAQEEKCWDIIAFAQLSWCEWQALWGETCLFVIHRGNGSRIIHPWDDICDEATESIQWWSGALKKVITILTRVSLTWEQLTWWIY